MTGEVLVPRGKTYTFENAAVEFTDIEGAPLSVVAITPVNLNVPDKCGVYTASVDVTVPKGRIEGSAFFRRDPNEPATSGPSVRHYSVPYIGATDANVYNFERAGVNIHGKPHLLHPNGDSAVPYDYRAIREGRWGLSVCNPKPIATLQWPSGAQGYFRWPAPGHDAIDPVDWSGPASTGLDRDAFTFVDDHDVAPFDPALDFGLKTETINLDTPMAYVRGAIEFNGCIGHTSIRSGSATISGSTQDDGLSDTFDDERGFGRNARTGNEGGAAKGVFLGAGTYEIAASRGPWTEGEYVVNLRRNLGDGVPGDYNGTIGVRRKDRETYHLAAGQENAITAPTHKFTTSQIHNHVDTNFGTNQSLYVGTSSEAYGEASIPIGFSRTLLNFEFGTDALPDDPNIISAMVTLNGIAASTNIGTVEAFLSPVAWEENFVTSNLYPSSISDTLYQDAFAGQLGPVTFTIDTDIVEGWLNGGTAAHGIALRQAQSRKDKPIFTQYASSQNDDATLRPRLEICYEYATEED